VNNSPYESIGGWSPDGKKLLYIVNDGNTEKDGLYTVDAAGTNQNLLTNTIYCCYYNATWSSNGKQVAFMHHNTGGLMYTINADSSGEQEIYPDNPRSPDWLYFNNYYWSPDGKTFLFTPIKDAGGEDERREIYAMNFDGSDIRPLVIGASDRPAWSPDGTQIAFQNRREGNWDIYVMNPDGANQRRLSDSPVYDQNPLWSPDGRYIAFESGRVGAKEIYVMDADGTNERRLTENYVTDNLLTWSPDGTQLLFSTVSPEERADWEPAVFDVYAVNVDGSNMRRLFQSHGGPVSWQPLP
jgi:Tol biopolymer transport system component